MQVEELADLAYAHLIERALASPGAELVDQDARLLRHRDGGLSFVALESLRDFLRAAFKQRGSGALAL
jgi:hypothetical protein